MNMDVTLKRIEDLGEKMRGLPEDERAVIYATIRTLVKELEDENLTQNKRGYNYIAEKLHELNWHAQSLAHLDDGNNHSDEQHWLWMYRAIESARNVPILAC